MRDSRSRVAGGSPGPARAHPPREKPARHLRPAVRRQDASLPSPRHRARQVQRSPSSRRHWRCSAADLGLNGPPVDRPRPGPQPAAGVIRKIDIALKGVQRLHSAPLEKGGARPIEYRRFQHAADSGPEQALAALGEGRSSPTCGHVPPTGSRRASFRRAPAACSRASSSTRCSSASGAADAASPASREGGRGENAKGQRPATLLSVH